MTEQKQRRRGVYLLPNLFTTAGLFAGFFAIIAAIDGRFEAAAIAIFVAMIMDGIDGRLARITNTQSDFGAEYDSLADMVSFGLAPALVMFMWSLSSMGKLGWIAAFVYTAGAALRLARFNTQLNVIDKNYFQGLASPPAAALIVGLVWAGEEYGIAGEDVAVWAFLLTISAGLLMVSKVRYHSFKGFDIKGKVPFVAIFFIALLFVFISTNPPYILFAMAFIYAVSGPILTLWQLRQRRRDRQQLAKNESDDNNKNSPDDERK
ncbi:CDP-diacylglycerol--serine O-phosphatidyltransferase [hydrothermal vent metagenome]|uniref:CDP-diacylglycerol--serine O-phosphatidyltransferase n=1 Tax=hydrothermal vent metagenome TaxID=652676 RepID=A0A3B0ZEX4_9ZZZZ